MFNFGYTHIRLCRLLLSQFFSKPSVTIVAYHRIIHDDYRGIRPYISVTESNLRLQIQFFKKHYSVVSLEEAIAWLKGGDVARRYLAITFDDGYSDNFVLGKKIFTEETVSLTVFITTGCVGGEGLLWPDRLRQLVYIMLSCRSIAASNLPE